MVVLERVQVDRITAAAREIRFGRTVVTVVATVLYVLGWLAAKVFALVWFAVVWCAAATKVGWADARKPKVR